MKRLWQSFLQFCSTRLAHLLLVLAAPVLFLVLNRNGIIFILFLLSLLVLYLSKQLSRKLKLIVGIVDLLAVMPVVGLFNGYYQDIVTQILIYAILAIGLNIVVGFAGLLNLGFVAFYAVGAYSYAIFASTQANSFIANGTFPVSGDFFWLFLILGFALSAGVGFLLGLPVLRLKGDYLAIVTLGFAEIIRILFNNMDKPVNISNGPRGITPIEPPKLFGIELSQPIHYYFIALLLLGLTVLFVSRINRSRIGRAFAAIREDELAARTMGIPVVKMKLLAFSLGAGLAGMMGVFFAAKQSFIDPSSFGFMESIGILAMVIMGGMGNLSGVVLGAVAVIMLQLNILKELSSFLVDLSSMGILTIPSQLDPAKYEKMVFGLILILMCIFRPQGFLPAKRSMDYINTFFRKKKDETAIEK